jgi:Fe-S cluster biosynthesis and repair protein YggX
VGATVSGALRPHARAHRTPHTAHRTLTRIRIRTRTRRRPGMARTVQCVHLKHEGEGLDYAPYPGELGKRIYNQISKEAWQLWMKHQTMLVNENRLNLADQRARQYLARQMELFLFGEGADKPAGYVPPST